MMNTQAPGTTAFHDPETSAGYAPFRSLSQAAVVGTISMTLAGISLIATLLFVLSLWMPAWLAALGLTVVLTALSLATFASQNPRSRLRGAVTPPPLRNFSAGPVEPNRQIELESDEDDHEGIQPTQPYVGAAILDDDEQETTAVRHVSALLEAQRRAQAIDTRRGTDPMFRKATRPSLVREV